MKNKASEIKGERPVNADVREKLKNKKKKTLIMAKMMYL